MKVAFLFLALLLTLFGNSYAAPNKEEYELQEQCGKRAEEAFKLEYGSGTYSDNERITMTSYRNHYNSRLNKCFILLTTLTTPKREGKDVIFFKQLYDINEKKEYGNYSRLQQKNFQFKEVMCAVLGKFCHSEDEWDSLVKPYMEE